MIDFGIVCLFYFAISNFFFNSHGGFRGLPISIVTIIGFIVVVFVHWYLKIMWNDFIYPRLEDWCKAHNINPLTALWVIPLSFAIISVTAGLLSLYILTYNPDPYPFPYYTRVN